MTIERTPHIWNPVVSRTDKVSVKATADTAIKEGTILLSDGAGTYSPIAVSTDLTATATKPAKRVAVCVEDTTVGETAKDVKAIVAGEVFIEALYEAVGYTATKAPAWILNEVGGLSNIAFLHVKEIK
mgnify:CR=1 FL=1